MAQLKLHVPTVRAMFDAIGTSSDELITAIDRLDAELTSKGHQIIKWRLIGEASVIGTEQNPIIYDTDTVAAINNIQELPVHEFFGNVTETIVENKQNIPTADETMIKSPVQSETENIQEQYGKYEPQTVHISSHVPQQSKTGNYFTASVDVQLHKGKNIYWQISNKYVINIPWEVWKDSGRNSESSRRYFNIPCSKHGIISDFTKKDSKWGKYLIEIDDTKETQNVA